MRQINAGPGPIPCRAWGTVRPCDRRERFPTAWKDPLELYGRLRQELTPPDFDSSVERSQVNELVRRRGAQWVWCNRHRLVSLRKFVSRSASAGVVQPPGRNSAFEVRGGSTL